MTKFKNDEIQELNGKNRFKSADVCTNWLQVAAECLRGTGRKGKGKNGEGVWIAQTTRQTEEHFARENQFESGISVNVEKGD
jgi:hypothetical protein